MDKVLMIAQKLFIEIYFLFFSRANQEGNTTESWRKKPATAQRYKKPANLCTFAVTAVLNHVDKFIFSSCCSYNPCFICKVNTNIKTFKVSKSVYLNLGLFM